MTYEGSSKKGDKLSVLRAAFDLAKKTKVLFELRNRVVGTGRMGRIRNQ